MMCTNVNGGFAIAILVPWKNFLNIAYYILNHIKHQVYRNFNFLIFSDKYFCSDAISCLWKGCTTPADSTLNFEAALRHLSLHLHHLLLKRKGATLLLEKSVFECSYPTDGINSVPPDLGEPFTCIWKDCSFQTNDVSDFYCHVSRHSELFASGNHGKRHCLCLWTNCHSR